MTLLEILFLFLGAFYAAIIFWFYMGIQREARREKKGSIGRPTISVIIPARNESDRIRPILHSLASQSYPAHLTEILIVDDYSSDDTAAVVSEFLAEQELQQFRLLPNERQGDGPTYKKNAVTFALGQARGELILTTDADCRVQPGWIESMVAAYDDDIGMVCGLVTFDPKLENRLFHKMQALEFAGLVFCGVGAIGNRYPMICNASNLSYRREAFEAVGGFAGHEHLPSGDDDLFMQDLHRKTRWKVRYNLNPDSINYTQPVDNVAAFLNQRSRWASKGRHYPGFLTTLLLSLIYFFYLLLLILMPVTVFGGFSIKILIAGILLKVVPESLVVYRSLDVLKRRDLLALIPVVEILQIPYIVMAGFAGFFNLFKWKQK